MEIEIIGNPNSGHGNYLFYANLIKDKLLNAGHNVIIFESLTIAATENRFKEIKEKNLKKDLFIFMGGDGTISVSVDRMLKSGLNVPVAFFPSGTVNDFTKGLNINKNVKKFVNMILNESKKSCDLALSNGIYTINVAGGGYFTHGANTYSSKAKKIFGKIVYYIKGAFSAFGMSPQRLKITVDDSTYEEEILIYLIANSKSVGGFKKMGALAKIDDGYFDLCAIKDGGISLIFTFFKLFFGLHHKDKNVIYQKGKNFKVELVPNIHEDKLTKKKKLRNTNPKFISTDIDGNKGPNLPLEVNVLENKLTVYYRK